MRGDTSYAQLFVACELLSHLADPGDPALDDCGRGILGLWNHCLQDGNEMIRFIPDPELQFAKEFYGETDEQYEYLYNNVMYLCKEVNASNLRDDLNDIRPDLGQIEKAVERSEKAFVDDVLKQVVQHTDPRGDDWRMFEKDKAARNEILTFLDNDESDIAIGVSNAIRFQRAAGVSDESVEDILAKGRYLADNYQVPIKLYKEILKRIVQTGCDLTKKNRANRLWDMQISFYLGPNNRVQGEQIVLVTDDGDIVKAAEEAGASRFVMSLSSYCGLLDL